MGLTEVLLILIGIIAFIGSFMIPEKLVKDTKIDISEDKINELIEAKMKDAEYKIEEKVDETVSAAAEKTERYMERMSNEKVMAIQEYSDTVLGQINKNHEESVFLYDMLNNKYAQVKNTSAEINAKVQEWKEDNTLTADDMSYDHDKKAEISKQPETNALESAKTEDENMMQTKKVATKRKNPAKKKVMMPDKNTENISNIDIQFEPDVTMGSNKEKILFLHREGKSNMAIAKSLGLGIGEVKLIIDLFESGK